MGSEAALAPIGAYRKGAGGERAGARGERVEVGDPPPLVEQEMPRCPDRDGVDGIGLDAVAAQEVNPRDGPRGVTAAAAHVVQPRQEALRGTGGAGARI